MHYIMCQQGFCIINYIDDYVGVGVLSVTHAPFQFLLSLMECLGLSVSQTKLVTPSTQFICLGILIDPDAGTVSIPSEKLAQINGTVQKWLSNTPVLSVNFTPFWDCFYMYTYIRFPMRLALVCKILVRGLQRVQYSVIGNGQHFSGHEAILSPLVWKENTGLM